MTKFFLIAGEASGDLHGRRLMEQLKKQFPNAIFEGVGGPLMRKKGLNAFLPMEDFQIIGLTQILRNLPKIIRQFLSVRNEILKTNPDAVIMIDYPGFNLRMAKSLRKRGYSGKLIQYICPTVWAWGKGRIQTMVQNLDLLLTIFPFEKECFEGTNLKVTYVGHPLTEHLSEQDRGTALNNLELSPDTQLLSLFPGSRTREIRKNLPKMVGAAKLWLNENPKGKLAISCATESFRSLIQEQCQKEALDPLIVDSSQRETLMYASYLAIAKVGTITLELALRYIPTVAVYEASFFNRLIFGYIFGLVRLPHLCIVNILAKKRVFPEQITRHLPVTEKSIHQALKSIDRAKCIAGCHHISQDLGREDASQNAAKSIVGLL